MKFFGSCSAQEAAGVLIAQLSMMWAESGAFGDEETFVREYLDPMFNDADVGSSLEETEDIGLESGDAAVEFHIINACARCILAIRAHRAGDIEESWRHVSEAAIRTGFISNQLSLGDFRKAVLRAQSKAGAKARHAEDYEMKDRIHAWWKENHHNYKSIESAATAYTRIEPIAQRTARKHIDDAVKTYSLPPKRTRQK